MFDIIKSNIDYSEKRIFLPTEAYLPAWATETEFFNDIIILLNYLENSLKDFSSPKYAQIAAFYKDIFFKYKNIDLLTETEIRQIIREQGYGLIIDMLDVDLEKLKVILTYIPLFKILKSTDVGYRFLLGIISYEFEIETWLDNPQDLDEYTYNIVLITFLNTGFDSSIINNFVKLSRFYVYPVLKDLTIKIIYRNEQPYVCGLPVIQKRLVMQCTDSLFVTFEIDPTPSNALVELHSSTSGSVPGYNSISVTQGSTVTYKVSCLGYFTQQGSYLMIGGNVTLQMVLDQGVYLQIFPNILDAEVTFEIIGLTEPIIDGGDASTVASDAIDGGSYEAPDNILDVNPRYSIEGNILTTEPYTIVKYTVSAPGYTAVSDTILLEGNTSIEVNLE